MFEYICLYLFILVGPLLVRNKFISNRLYCGVVSLSMIALCGLRNIHLGLGDTLDVYRPVYLIAAQKNFSELINLYEFVSSGVTYVPNSSAYSIGFLLLVKLSSLIVDNYHFFLLVCSFIYFVPICFVIYKHSKIPALSFVIFLALNGFASAFYLIRHEIAMGFIVLAWYCFFNSKRTIALFCILLAASVHISAIAFLVIFLFDRIKINAQRVKFFSVGALWFGVLLSSQFAIGVSFIGRFIPYYNHYLEHNTGQFASLSIIAAGTALFSVQKFYKISDLSRNSVLYFHGIIMYIGMLSCQVIIDEFNRLALFFILAPATLLPNALHFFDRDKKILYGSVFFLGFSIYFFAVNVINYRIYPYSSVLGW